MEGATEMGNVEQMLAQCILNFFKTTIRNTSLCPNLIHTYTFNCNKSFTKQH